MSERDHPSYWQEYGVFGTLSLRGVRTDVEARHHQTVETGQPRTFLDSELYLLTPSGVRSPATFAVAQSFHYPADRTVVITALGLSPLYQTADPRENYPLRQLWVCYERLLRARYPEAEQLMTDWNDAYPRERWSGFLGGLGYTQSQPAVFRKRVAPRPW